MKQKIHRAVKKLRRLALPLAGFGAFLWFLVRVIPKPSRASYPCMRAAAPLASSFVIAATAFFSSVVFFKKARGFLYRSRYLVGSLCLSAGLVLGLASLIQSAPPAMAGTKAGSASSTGTSAPVLGDGPNMPMGMGQGIFPGRVVWVHNPDATNQDFKNGGTKLWFQDGNTDQAVVGGMLADGLETLTGTATPQTAWDALFRNFNKTRDRGDAGYTPGEIIVIKINLNGTGNGRQNINTSPQVCYALLDQLVNVLGVAQNCIYLGDPNIEPDAVMYKRLFEGFPDVHYWGTGPRRTKVKPTAQDVIFASDGGTSDPLPQVYADAAYMINVPVLKKHHRAGISLTAKNHFGSITPFNGNGAFNWHYSLPVPEGNAGNSNGGYGVYRCLVDFMGHRDIGGKTVLYLVDGLWGSINWGHPAIKWRMAPFNGDWPSSLFLSQDPVAIDSVGYDFLRSEFDRNHPTEGRYDPRDNSGPFPQYKGVDDYLHQAADARNRPAGLVYDPEKDGTPLPDSLGVHEHWNNSADKQYSRNLGGKAGIELVYVGPAAIDQNAAAASATPPSPGISGSVDGTPAGDTSRFGAVFGEFQDDELYRRSVDAAPAMKRWTGKELVDGLSSATIQAKTMGHAVPDRIVLLNGQPVAWADGFGQFWLSLPPGTYRLTGRCGGYADCDVTVACTEGSREYLNFFMKKTP